MAITLTDEQKNRIQKYMNGRANRQTTLEPKISDEQITAFVAYLVELVTDLKIDDIPDEYLQNVVNEVSEIYFEFLGRYLEEAKSKSKSLQYSAFSAKGDFSFLRGLDGDLKEAHEAFIENIYQLKTI